MQHEPATRRASRAGRLWKWTAPILASLLAMPAMAQEGLRASNVQCVSETALDAGGYTLNCTANDIRIARATILPDANGNAPKCLYPGAPLTFKAIFEVESTATERYDVGMWFAADGDPNGDGALTGKCSVATLPTGGSSRGANFINIDAGLQPGDACGDIKKPDNNPLYPEVEMTVTCVDYDKEGDPGFGKLDVPYCTSWRQQGSNQLCTSAQQAFPGAPSKCKCDRTFDVAIEVPAAALRVVKTPRSATIKEPGEDVIFDVRIYNDAIEPGNSVRLTSLQDVLLNQSGAPQGSVLNIASGEASPAIKSTTCAKDTVIGYGGQSVPCEFTMAVTGNAGATVADRVTVSGVDARSNVVEGSGDATVRIEGQAPTISISKAANPTRVKNPGGNVTFTVTVTNTSPAGLADPIAITKIEDQLEDGTIIDLSGQGTCNSSANPYPTALAAGSTYSCTFTRFVAGDGVSDNSDTDTVTGYVKDDEGITDSKSASATVNITATGALQVNKSASFGTQLNKDSVDVPEPGGDVTFAVAIKNMSTVKLTVTSIKEQVSLNGESLSSAYEQATSCGLNFDLAPGESRRCTFTAVFNGQTAGDSHMDVITAYASDPDGDVVSASGSATVSFTDVLPVVSLTKSVERARVTYEVKVANTSVESVEITSLQDDKFGDVTRDQDSGNASIESTTCTKGWVEAGKTYVCSFDAYVGPTNSEGHKNVVTGEIADNDGNSITRTDDALVVLQ